MFRAGCVLSGLILLTLVSVGLADESTSNNTTVEKLIRRAGQRSGRGDFEGALADIEKALQLDPRSADAFNQRGTVYYNQAKYAEALADYNKAVEFNPQHADAYANRGNTRYAMQDYKGAVEDYRKDIEMRPDSQYAWNRCGIGQEAAGNMMAALACYDKTVSLDPTFADGWSNRGDAKRKLGMHKQAIEDYSKAIDLDSSRATYFNRRGLARGQIDDLAGAVADLTQALSIDPKMAAAHENRWLVNSRLGHADAAQQDWNEYLKLAPNDHTYLQSLADKLLPVYKQWPAPKTVDDFVNRGNAFYRGAYYVQAATDYRRATEIDDFSTAAFFDLALALNNLGYYDGAIDAYKKCVEADDRYFEGLYQMGELYRYRLGQPDEAIVCFDRALAVKPDYASALESRGAAKKDKSDFAGALKDFEKVLELNPNSSFAYWNRGDVAFKQGSFQKAIADVTKACELDPKNSYPLQLRGQIKRQMKDYPGAVADFTAAYGIFNGAYILMHRGLTYLDMGKTADAQKDFDEAVKLYPGIKPELDREIEKAKAGGVKVAGKTK